MKFLHIIILSLLISLSCQSNKVIQASMNDTSTLSNQDGWESVPSDNGDFILYYETKTEPSNPRLSKKFYVTNKGGEKVYEGSIEGGYVKWFDESKLEFFSPPGMMPTTMTLEDFITIYDLVEKKKYAKSEMDNDYR